MSIVLMMDDSAPTHERRKLIKTYKKIVLLQKRPIAAEVCGETYSKNDINRWSRKTCTEVKDNPTNDKIKRGTLERESE